MIRPAGYYRSSSFKMAALFTCLLGVSGVLLGYFLYDSNQQNFIRETEAAIDSEIEHLLALAAVQGQPALVKHVGQRSQQSRLPVYFYQSSTAEKIAGNIDALPQAVTRIKEGVIQFTLNASGEPRTVAAKIHTFNDGAQLLIARDIHDLVRHYQQLSFFSGLTILLMLIVILVSFLISIFVVSRINRIAHTARHIMETGDLSRRISIDSSWDDLSHLAQTLNHLLDRVESLMQGIRDVSDSIAHDLRTPLTRLRNHVESAKKNGYTPGTADCLLAEADGILSTFSALLRIATIEKGRHLQSCQPIHFNSLLQDVVELYEPLAEEKQITLQTHYSELIPYNGDRDLLFQLFANLVDNAIKFSHHGGCITLSSDISLTGCCIRIADNGEGIAAQDKKKVFNRFYRADKSRHTIGNGLGLSLVKAIVERHGAHIALIDNHPGVLIEVSFEYPS